MTHQILKNRLGTPYFNDATTDIQCCLPEGLIIYSYTGRIWLGGGERPTDLLYIERVSAEVQAVPTILADGDIDLTLVSVGTAEQLACGAKGVKVAGNYRDKYFGGYLSLVPINEDFQYLVMVAGTNLVNEERQRSVCRSVQDSLQIAA
ncbi:MAG: hypothetical protein HRU41_35370 [Saprospiraceae bacterium]|nr:hypothetical protein [Saprospiraceae bacterium]